MGTFALLAALGLAACGSQDEQASQPADTPAAIPAGADISSYAGAGRDRLCLADQGNRAAFITYGDGDANCSLLGSVQRAGDRLTITPEGDSTCRVEATLTGDRLTLGDVAPACAYYCGPSASFAGKQFTRTPTPQPVTDIAGDPLC